MSNKIDNSSNQNMTSSHSQEHTNDILSYSGTSISSNNNNNMKNQEYLQNYQHSHHQQLGIQYLDRIVPMQTAVSYLYNSPHYTWEYLWSRHISFVT